MCSCQHRGPCTVNPHSSTVADNTHAHDAPTLQPVPAASDQKVAACCDLTLVYVGMTQETASAYYHTQQEVYILCGTTPLPLQHEFCIGSDPCNGLQYLCMLTYRHSGSKLAIVPDDMAYDPIYPGVLPHRHVSDRTQLVNTYAEIQVQRRPSIWQAPAWGEGIPPERQTTERTLSHTRLQLGPSALVRQRRYEARRTRRPAGAVLVR